MRFENDLNLGKMSVPQYVPINGEVSDAPFLNCNKQTILRWRVNFYDIEILKQTLFPRNRMSNHYFLPNQTIRHSIESAFRSVH